MAAAKDNLDKAGKNRAPVIDVEDQNSNRDRKQ